MPKVYGCLCNVDVVYNVDLFVLPAFLLERLSPFNGELWICLIIYIMVSLVPCLQPVHKQLSVVKGPL